MSKKIPLTQSQFAIVDDIDYEWLSKHKWCAHFSKQTQTFYAARCRMLPNGKKRYVSMAREILRLKYGDKRQSDHIHHNTLDNQRKHLRVVTSQENGFNRRNPKGYSWDSNAQKYRARINLNHKFIDLGHFKTTREAHNAYLSGKKKYHQIPERAI